MDAAVVRQMIVALAAEEEALSEVINKADLRRAQVQAARLALTVLETEEPIEFEGKLSDACRAVLKKSAKALTPVEVRDELKVIGYDITKHTNIMASVHSVLKRFVESGDAEPVTAKDGTKYRSKGNAQVERAVCRSASGLGSIGDLLKNPLGDDVLGLMQGALDPSSALIEALKAATSTESTDAFVRRVQESMAMTSDFTRVHEDALEALRMIEGTPRPKK